MKEQIVVNGKNVPVYDQNPNHITFKGLPSRQNGNHRPNNDKLTVKNLPLSVSNQEIEKLLKEKNVLLVSPIFYGKIRDEIFNSPVLSQVTATCLCSLLTTLYPDSRRSAISSVYCCTMVRHKHPANLATY